MASLKPALQTFVAQRIVSTFNREVVRCGNPKCELVQFRPRRDPAKCRKCKVDFNLPSPESVVTPTPTPLVPCPGDIAKDPFAEGLVEEQMSGPIHLAGAVRYLREARGWTVKELGRRVKNLPLVMKIERGGSAPTSQISPIAAALGMKMEDLLLLATMSVNGVTAKMLIPSLPLPPSPFSRSRRKKAA